MNSWKTSVCLYRRQIECLHVHLFVLSTTAATDLQCLSEENAIKQKQNRPFAASGHMVHAGGQAAHWDIQNKATSSR